MLVLGTFNIANMWINIPKMWRDRAILFADLFSTTENLHESPVVLAALSKNYKLKNKSN